ncbi:MAG TPA: hypothetical protein VGL89_17690 [Candidatus Koribacter sp.]|jgi:Tfp pilus assembly protein PilP
MNVRTGLLMLMVASGVLWAQSTSTATPAASQAPATKSSAKAKTTATKKTVKAKTASSTNAATNVASKPKKVAASSQKRDPFISPVQAHVNGPINCGTGKRCLVIDQTNLQGVVKAPNGMIAVVANSANKAYFLRENDPVYNGYVMRITPDSVVFRETVSDKLGRKSTREVVKKVNAPAV